jgi:hypothetical protein
MPRLGAGYRNYARDNPVLFRGYPLLAFDEFWPVFFYRFVGLEERSGDRVNYSARMRTADAHLLPSRWVVLHCPATGTRRAY